MVHTIVEKVNGNAALINLDQSKAFDSVDHSFLEAVLSAAGFGLHFHSWIRLYVSSGVVVEVNRALHFDSLDLSGLPAVADALYSCT